ncbi:MAG TPA: GEVED domain-containing protein [Moheibacter sp.]|nr:GEVED domain-containing protein [Moheibacter sp.]
MRKNLFYLLLIFLPILGFGQILQEGFESVSDLETNGWVLTNQSQPVGTTNWYQGSVTNFPSQSGAPNAYIGANFNNTSGSGGIISNWLITPSVNVKDGDKFSFYTRTATGSIWNDRLEVRSSQGTLALPSGSTGVGSFSTLHLVINDGYDLSYPEVWQKFEFVISGVGSTPVAMNFAFRYNVDNSSGDESNAIGIDTLLIEEGSGTGGQDYCIPEGTNVTRFINSFSTTGATTNISNMASGFSSGGYGDYYDTHELKVAEGETVTFTANISGGSAGFRIWIDANQDGVFDETEEVAYQSTGYSETQTGTISIPADALVGETRMRVVSHWLSTTGNVSPCATGFTYGEFEDYKLTIVGPLEYCIPEGTNVTRFINDFSTSGGAVDISNMGSGFSTGGYGDFYATHVLEASQGSNVSFTANISGGTAGFRIWIDANQDGVFDENEEVAYQSTGYSATQTGTISIPADALVGETRMRIVSHWLSTTGAVSPCATGFSYGEFEDYKVNIVPSSGGGGTGGDCEMSTPSNGIEDGFGNMHLLILANDFVVEQDVDFSLEKISANFLVQPNQTVQSANITFYEDSGNGPGAAIGSAITGLVPTSQSVIGGDFGFDLRDVQFELPSAVDFASSSTGQTVYWVGMRIVYGGSNSYMEVTSNYSTPNTAYLSLDDGASWDSSVELFGDAGHGVMKLEGTCAGDETPPTGGDCEQGFAVTDPTDTSYGIGFTGGNIVANDVLVSAGESFTVQTIEFDVIAINGQPTGFGLEIFEDSGTGGVGASTGMTYQFDSSNMSFTSLGLWDGFYPLFKVTLTLPDVELIADAAEDTSYWLALSSNLSTTGDFTYWSSALYPTGSTSYPAWQYLASSGSWAEYSGTSGRAESVMWVEGICSGDGGTEPEPGNDCEQGVPSSPTASNAYNITSTNDFRTAEDFVVATGGTFTMNQIIINTNQIEVPNNAVIRIHSDNGGQPGAVIETITMAPSSSTVVGTAYGDPIHRSVFDLATPIQLTEGTYWLDPKMSTPSSQTVWWAAIDTGSYGALPQRSQDNGATWTQDVNGSNMVFTVSGICSDDEDPTPGGPCDDKVIMECGVEYTKTLVPSAGEWVNYTGVSWSYTGSEQVYEFTAPLSGLYTFDLNEGAGDADFFLMDACSNTAVNLLGSTYWTGAGSESYTLTEGQTVYLIADLWELSGQTTISIKVNCTDGNDFACENQAVPSNNLENGLFFGGDTNQRLAFDIITDDAGFPIYGVDLNVFVGSSTDIDFFITLYDDQGGVPGSVVESGFGTVFSNEFIGDAFGYDIYNYVVKFENPMNLSANTTYWMEVEADAVAWEATGGAGFGSRAAFNNDSTAGDWALSSNELVYKLICHDLGVSDLNAFDFAYYPNPVRDVLNITSKVGVKSVEVFNLAGQNVLRTMKVSQGQVDVSALATGTYVFRATLENGQVETFKIIKK